MSFIEKDGNKIAVGLCIASCLPIGATVYAMENNESTNKTQYQVSDTLAAKHIQEIEADSYYIDETVENVQPVAATVTAAAADEVENTVSRKVLEVVEQEISKQSETENEEVETQVPADETVTSEQEATVKEEDKLLSETPDEENLTVSEPEAVVENVAAETVSSAEISEPEVVQPVIEEVQIPEEPVYTAPVIETPVTQEEVIEEPVVEEQVAQEPVYQQPAVQDPVVEEPVIEEPVAEQPVVEAPVYEEPTPEVQVEEMIEEPVVEEPAVQEPVYQEPVQTPEVLTEQNPVSEFEDLNRKIVDAAYQLVNTTNGMQCTEIAQMALAGAGVEDAMSLWPDQYADTYGYYTDNPQAGNLIYYDQGGRGTDHIAVYVGDGMAVHGNYWIGDESYTVVASVNLGSGSTPQYIQVQR